MGDDVKHTSPSPDSSRDPDRSQNVFTRPRRPATPLFYFQLQTVQFMQEHRRVLVAKEMGLGKTISTLATTIRIVENDPDARVLILVPSNLHVHNWEAEFRTHFGHVADSNSCRFYAVTEDKRGQLKGNPQFLRNMLQSGNIKILCFPYSWLTPTYSKVMKRKGLRNGVNIMGHKSIPTKATRTTAPEYIFDPECWWDCLVCDEAQAFKNPASVLYKAVRSINVKENVGRVYFLTGKPIENDHEELRTLFSAMGIEDPALKGLLTSDNEWRRAVADRMVRLRERRLDTLMNDYMFRVLKRDVLRRSFCEANDSMHQLAKRYGWLVPSDDMLLSDIEVEKVVSIGVGFHHQHETDVWNALVKATKALMEGGFHESAQQYPRDTPDRHSVFKFAAVKDSPFGALHPFAVVSLMRMMCLSMRMFDPIVILRENTLATIEGNGSRLDKTLEEFAKYVDLRELWAREEYSSIDTDGVPVSGPLVWSKDPDRFSDPNHLYRCKISYRAPFTGRHKYSKSVELSNGRMESEFRVQIPPAKICEARRSGLSTKLTLLANLILKIPRDEKVVIFVHWLHEMILVHDCVTKVLRDMDTLDAQEEDEEESSTESDSSDLSFDSDYKSEVRRARSSYAVLIYGDLADSGRAQALREFGNNHACRILIANIKIMGTGLNLCMASRVIFPSVWYNPGKECQAMDRCDRFGQKRTVVVYYLMVDGTIDLYVFTINRTKLCAAAIFMDGLEPGTHYNPDQLLEFGISSNSKKGNQPILREDVDKHRLLEMVTAKKTGSKNKKGNNKEVKKSMFADIVNSAQRMLTSTAHQSQPTRTISMMFPSATKKNHSSSLLGKRHREAPSPSPSPNDSYPLEMSPSPSLTLSPSPNDSYPLEMSPPLYQ